MGIFIMSLIYRAVFKKIRSLLFPNINAKYFAKFVGKLVFPVNGYVMDR